MVRAIVGTLVQVGSGDLVPEACVEILASRDRTRAGPTAPPQGLVLVAISYA
jgi:tRNA pseudouridine38-40 synthase